MASTYALSTEIVSGVAVITIDLPGEPVNKLNRAVKDEFVALFDRLERDLNVKAAVLISGKKDSFIAGADIEEFLQLKSAAEAERLSHEGQLLLDSIHAQRTPLVVAIHGACMGGALELALAAHYRIATDHPKTVLALPEVQIGLIPGAGGTQCLPRLIGVRAALDMILTGKNVRAKKAMQTGLVDELVHPAILRKIAIQRAQELAEGTVKHKKHSGGMTGFLLDENPAGRRVVLKKAREETMKKTRGNYPAPLAAIDAVEAGYRGGASHGYRTESRLFGEMSMTDVCRQLIHIFFATTALKKDPGVPLTPGAPQHEIIPVEKVGILGAGFMGAGIASIAIQQGTLVRMKDADHGRVAKGFAAVRDVVKERLTKRQNESPVFGHDVAAWRHGRLLRLRQRRPRDRSSVRGHQRKASGPSRSRSRAQAERYFRIQHEHHSDRRDCARFVAARASCRDAFFLTRAQDAAARGDRS